MTDELYIEGQRADIGPDTNIYITYRSNLFGDISKIQGNNTGTIKLPMTARNIELMEASIHPAGVSQFPFEVSTATVKRDGVDVISKAKLTLLKVTDTAFEVALTWGPSEAIQRLLNTDLMLSDLDFDGTHIGESITWGQSDGLLYTPVADYGIRYDETEIFAHPAVPITDFIEAIEHTFDIELNFDNEPWYTSVRNEWVVPLIQRNAEKIGRLYNVTAHSHSPQEGIIGKIDVSGEHYEFLTFFVQDERDLQDETWDTPHYAVDAYTDERGMGESYVNFMVPKRRGITQSVTTNLSMNILASNINEAASVSLCLITYIGESLKVMLEAKPSQTPISRSSYAGKTIYEVNFQLNGETSNESELGEESWKDGAFTVWAVRGPVSIYSVLPNQTMRVVYSQKYVQPNNTNADIPEWWLRYNTWYTNSLQNRGRETGKYLLAPNMPKMKVLDFLKQLMQMCGKFAYIDEADGSALKFVDYDHIYTNRHTPGKTYDWSKYLVSRPGWMPAQMEFKVGDEAQINRFLYSDGSSLTKEMDGEFTISNETLPETRDAVKLQFVDYDQVGNLARIPLYSYEYKTEDGEQEGEQTVVISKKDFKPSDKPYIAVRHGSNSAYYINSDGIRWPQLLERYGRDPQTGDITDESYIGMMNQAHVITETFVLPPYVLNTLDITRPVYLKQHASYFGIIEIKTKANDTAEVKLIKI